MIDVVTHLGRIVADGVEDALTQYEKLARAQWEELREAEKELRIMDSVGNLHPLPDRGPCPV